MRHPCGGQAEATIACGGIPPHVLDGWAPGRVLLLFELHVWSAIGLARLRRLFGLALVFALPSVAGWFLAIRSVGGQFTPRRARSARPPNPKCASISI